MVPEIESMNQLILIVLTNYILPAILSILVIYLVEKKNKVWPCRDKEEIAGRVFAACMSCLFFTIFQLVAVELLNK